MEFGIFNRLLIVSSMLLLGACSSSGIVAGNVNLAIANVEVTQSGEVNERRSFNQQLSEAIRYEFSRASSDGVIPTAVLMRLDVQKLAYSGMAGNDEQSGITQMSAYGWLFDAQTGDNIGSFPVEVKYLNDGDNLRNSLTQVFDHSTLMRLMARATLAKVYGKRRAEKIAGNPATYQRKPYLVSEYRTSRKNGNSIQTSALRPSISTGFPSVGFFGPPTKEDMENQTPKVISAPQLPIQ
jgi:hypothetical protein